MEFPTPPVLPPDYPSPAEQRELDEQEAWMDSLRDRLAQLEAAAKPERKPRQHPGYYSPEELGELWNVSSDMIRRLFEHEPGVVVLGQPEKGKRRYRTIRIPQEVADRVQRRLSNPEKR